MQDKMKHYRHVADAAFGAIILIAMVICTIMVLSTVAYLIACRIFGSESIPVINLLPCLGSFLVFMVAVFIVRYHLFHSSAPGWSYISLLVCTVISLLFAFGWFQDPMHDIALLFDSHGRWGCNLIEADGASKYLLHDGTVPWVIFAPVILATVFHWIWSRR